MQSFRNVFGVLGVSALLLAFTAPAIAAPDTTPVNERPVMKRDSRSVRGGFHGPSTPPVTVEQAKKFNDDARVVLRGNLVQRIDADEYTFRDASGTITVEIDEKHWNDQRITPEDTVIIFGKLDKDRGEEVKIEARRVVKQ